MAAARSKRCAYCNERLRSKHNIMHRRCEREYYDPPAPIKAKRPDHTWPPSKFCPACRRLHNGSTVPEFCCGVTIAVPEDIGRRERDAWARF